MPSLSTKAIAPHRRPRFIHVPNFACFLLPWARETGLDSHAAPPKQLRSAGEGWLGGKSQMAWEGLGGGRPLPLGPLPSHAPHAPPIPPWLAPTQTLTPSQTPGQRQPTHPGDHGTVGHRHQEQQDPEPGGTPHGRWEWSKTRATPLPLASCCSASCQALPPSPCPPPGFIRSPTQAAC